MQKAVVLLSGGLDSTTCVALAKAGGYDVHALTIRYGQRHEMELACAHKVAKAMGIEDHVVLDVDLRKFGGSALTSSLEVPKGRDLNEKGIPITYVPARNTVFLSLALACAEALGACDIFIGVNALDYSGYPDCRPDFIEAFEKTANLATRAGIEGKKFRIHTPLIEMSKAEIIKTGIGLGVDYSLTTSCYDPSPDSGPCGRCDACLLRAMGFAEAGVEDPLG